MFTYIKVKNFKSLKELEINLRKNSSSINNFIAIYGENGSGKTNIIEIFKFLTLSFSHKIMKTKVGLSNNSFVDNTIKTIVNPLLLDFNYSSYRTIDCEEPTEIEYSFEINGKEGSYFIKFYDEVIEERLHFKVTRQNNYYYEISKAENKIIKKLNEKVFVKENYKNELKEEIEKYWGKFSFLSILNNEINEKNLKYMHDSLNDNIFDIFNMIEDMNVFIDRYKLSQLFIDYASTQMDLVSLKTGTIRKKDTKEKLLKYEQALKLFFTQSYFDVKDVKYDFIEKEDYTEYKLYFYKKIGSRIIKIPIDEESSGTIKLIEHFKTLMGCLDGKIVIVDEIDNGIHDLLIKNIFESLLDKITGQLIVTTHNTLLLEFVPKEKIYILSTDSYNNKILHNINDYDVNVQKNNNLRNLYLKGVFGGIPTNENIHFDNINTVLFKQK